MGVISCEDFLDRPAEDGYNVGVFYKNDAQVEMGVNYLYASPWYDFQRAFIKIGEVMSGNMYMSKCPYLTFTTGGSDEDLVNMSYALWSVNGHANTIIANILNSEGPSKAAKDKAIGEALTWKAMAYFYMVRTFGEVPIIHDNTAVITSGTYNDVYRADRASVYEYIVMTLEKALELLPKQTSGWNGRIDYYAAEALLSKVYLTKAGVTGTLNQNDLKKAAELSEDVILNSGRQLTPKYSDIFRLSPDLYNQTGENLISWMWESKQGRWTGQNSFQSDLIFEFFSEHADMWGGWGGPSYDLALAFGVDPLKAPSTRGEDKEADTRRKASMMMAGDQYEYFWTTHQTKTGFTGFDLLYYIYAQDAEYATYGMIDSFQGPCGMQNVKHLFGDGADHEAALGYKSARMSYTLPTHLLRLADIYLVCAEANLLSGDAAKALEYVNKVRARAINEKVDPTDGALTSVTYDDIWKERRLELAGEGDRWYDFVRRSYFEMDVVIEELKAQKRNAVAGYSDACKKYWYTGCGGTLEKAPEAKDLVKFDASKAEWETDESKLYYDTTVSAPNVTSASFVLPLPTEDIVFNPHLLDPAQPVDVRATYVYNF